MVQVTKRTSWFERLSSSISGIFVGIGLVLAMIAMLFWNEGDAVQIQRSLDEGAGLVVSADSSKADPGNEGRLVHLTGLVESGEMPKDEAFGISAPGLRLIRKVMIHPH